MNKVDYKEFKTSEEAEQWGYEHYADLMQLCDTREKMQDNCIGQSLAFYTGSLYLPLNRLLRACPPMGSPAFEGVNFGDYEEEKAELLKINAELHKHALPENIIAYRFTHKSLLRQFCNGGRIKTGATFTDRAFMSTTLVKDLLREFAEQHRCNCVLKLYLPIGTPGAYVSAKNDRGCLNEQEFLLPPNLRLKIIKQQNFAIKPIIECLLISDEEVNK